LPSTTTRQAFPAAIVNERRKEHRRPAQPCRSNHPVLIL
jgi:hypothetical protein